MRDIALMVIGFVLTTGCSGLLAQESVPTAIIKRLTDQGPAEEVGTVTFHDSRYGLLIEPNLRGLPPGMKGTHIHENRSCASGAIDFVNAPGIGAGNHYDPMRTGEHMGPYGDGHLGDLPNIIVEQDGTASLPVLAPRLKTSDLSGRSIIVHAGKDNYSNSTGGGRAYCGVIN
jgi:superoxide dismutase, Cu-Zn family